MESTFQYQPEPHLNEPHGRLNGRRRYYWNWAFLVNGGPTPNADARAHFRRRSIGDAERKTPSVMASRRDAAVPASQPASRVQRSTDENAVGNFTHTHTHSHTHTHTNTLNGNDLERAKVKIPTNRVKL